LAQVLSFSNASPIVRFQPLVMPIALEIYDDDPDDLQYMVVLIMFSPKRCVVIFVSGCMSLEECSSFVQAFLVSVHPPDASLFFERHTTINCRSAGYTLPDSGMPWLLEYFRQRFEFARRATWEFTDEYTFSLHRHILKHWEGYHLTWV
jgi:hypothetical protein